MANGNEETLGEQPELTTPDGEEAAPSYALLPASDTAFCLGTRPVTVRQAETFTVLCISVLAGLLLFKNLGDQYLWQDEAQTALLAKTILTDGIPRGYDGKNYLSQEFGIEYWGNFPYVYRWHTWLSFYLVAGSFSIFGINTFAARFPCALLGLATVPLTYYFARELWQSRRAATLAAFLLAVNVSFLILSRQCRYYSECTFLMLLGLWAYDRLMRRKPWAAFWFVFAAVFLFHAFYVYWGMLLAAVLIHTAIFHRDRFSAVLAWSALTFLLVLPWLVWYFWPGNAAVYKESVADASFSTMLLRYSMMLYLYSAKLCIYVFPLILLAVFPILAIAGLLQMRFGGKPFPWPDAATLRSSMFLMLITAIGIVTLVLATPNYFFRYVAPLVPLLCILASRILEAAMRLRISFGIIMLAMILMVSRMDDYFYEITHHLYTPAEAISKYLNAHANPNDVVAISYGDMPIKFYTNLRVVGGLTGEDLTPVDTARWLILRRTTLASRDRPRDVIVFNRLYSLLQKNSRYYHPIELKCLDTIFDNRESPDDHRYQTATKETDRDAERVLIQERIVPKSAESKRL